MPEIARLVGGSDCVEVDFLEREAIPAPAMKLGIQLHLDGLSLLGTISILDRLGVDRCRSTVHNWVQNFDIDASENNDLPSTEQSALADFSNATTSNMDYSKVSANRSSNPSKDRSGHIECPVTDCEYQNSVASVAAHVSGTPDVDHDWESLGYDGARDFKQEYQS